MNRHAATCALLLAGLLPLVAADAPLPSATAKSQGKRITDRIDAIFRQRLKPVPLPVTLPNPFIVVGGGVSAKRTDGSDAEPAGETTGTPGHAKPAGETPTGTDAEILARLAAKLKIGGTIEVNGITQLIINQAVGSSRVDLQACKLEYSIVSPK